MIYELSNFLSPNECNKYIDMIDSNKIIVPFTNSGKFINNKWKDVELASLFYEKLELYNIKDNVKRPNNIIMSGKYIPGDSFSLHTDTGLFYDKNAKEETRWTLLIYLNDNYVGGETIFYDDKWDVTKIVKPELGKAILFDIDLWHKANELNEGIKYWIGCEMIGNMIK